MPPRLTVCTVVLHFNAIDLVEYHALNPVVTRCSPDSKTQCVDLHVKRLSRYFVVNLFGVVCILTMVAFFVFLVDKSDFADRINMIITLLLTQVAFKFATMGLVPRVSYSTHVDTYGIGSIFFLFAVAVICAVQSIAVRYGHEEAWWSSDAFSFCEAFFIFIVFHGLWILSVSCKAPLDRLPEGLKHIQSVEGKNFYGFNFANPMFCVAKPPAPLSDPSSPLRSF